MFADIVKERRERRGRRKERGGGPQMRALRESDQSSPTAAPSEQGIPSLYPPLVLLAPPFASYLQPIKYFGSFSPDQQHQTRPGNEGVPFLAISAL